MDVWLGLQFAIAAATSSPSIITYCGPFGVTRENGIYNLIESNEPCTDLKKKYLHVLPSPRRPFHPYLGEVTGILPPYAYLALKGAWGLRMQQGTLMLINAGILVNSHEFYTPFPQPTVIQISGGDQTLLHSL